MPQFKSEDGEDFALRKLGEQRIGDENAVYAEKSIRRCIAMSGTSTAIDDLDAVYAESNAIGERLDLIGERGRRERREPIKERKKKSRVNEIQNDGEKNQSGPENEERTIGDVLMRRPEKKLRGEEPA